LILQTQKYKALKKAKLSKDGEKVLKILQGEYHMGKEDALKLMQDGGTMLAMAILSRTLLR
jgi:hypothetical protein